MPFHSIHPFPYLFLLLLAPVTLTHAFTLPILPLNITSLTQNLTTSLLDPAIFRGHCVDDSRFSNWSGVISSADCLIAQHKLELRVPQIGNKQYTFWSRKYTRTPPIDGWELPLMARYRTCILLFQITKDFGDGVVPFYQGGYLPTSRLATVVRGSWEMVLGAVAAVRLQCLKRRGQPGWADVSGWGGGKGAVVVALPAGSGMAREWGMGAGVEVS